MARNRGRTRITGVAEVTRNLQKMEDAVTSAAADEIGRIAGDVAATARRTVPYVTGYLQSRIRDRKLPGARDVKGSAREVIDDAEYALYVHEGTARSRAHPFLRNALDVERPHIERRVSSAMEDAMQRESL